MLEKLSPHQIKLKYYLLVHIACLHSFFIFNYAVILFLYKKKNLIVVSWFWISLQSDTKKSGLFYATHRILFIILSFHNISNYFFFFLFIIFFFGYSSVVNIMNSHYLINCVQSQKSKRKRQRKIIIKSAKYDKVLCLIDIHHFRNNKKKP